VQGKSFSQGGGGVDFHVRRPAERAVFLGSSCPSLHTCLALAHHHCCSPFPAGEGFSQHPTHTPLP